MDTITPPHAGSAVSAEIEKGYRALREGRFQEALQLARELAAAHPEDQNVLILAAEASLAADDPPAALDWTERALVASGGDPRLKVKKARLLGLMRRRSEVPALAAEIAAEAGEDGHLRWALGILYQRNNLQAEAIAQMERARGSLGDLPGLLYDLAVSRFFHGDFDAAERDLNRLLQLAPQFGPAMYLRATLRRQTADSNHVTDLERRLRGGLRNPDDEITALYALAKELEDLGEHDKAFAALAAGASRKRVRLGRYDVETECAAMQALRDTYTAAVMAEPVAGCDEPGAIFIVGMPRTGTTLVERLLVQSGQVRAAGELQDFGNLLGHATQTVMATHPGLSSAQASLHIDHAALGSDYLRGAREAVGGNPLFIDKMPVNFLYCGIIRRALPNARIVHLVRDPLDCCYAVFKTFFYNSYSFSYDLDDLARYYIAYHEMMRHWHAVMPGVILDVRYEDLVADPEGQTRRLYEWCGLPWSPEVLEAPKEGVVFATASAAQVREPVHARSVGGARRHAGKMQRLVTRLTAAGILSA